MSTPKIFPTCFHQDAKRKHKSLRNWIIVPWIMEQLHICVSFLLPSGGTDLLCAAAQSLSCPWVMRTPPLCNCTLGTTIHTEAGRTWTLQGKLSTARAVGASTDIPHHCCSRTTCTEQSHHQGLRADFKRQDSTQCPHPTRSQR